MRPVAFVVVALVASGAFLIANVTAHEWLHCASAWARDDIGHTCRVEYYAPGTHERAGTAYTGALPWWEHPLLYTIHFAAVVGWSALLSAAWDAMTPRERRTRAPNAPT